MPDSLRNLIFANFEPVYKCHETFLKDVEQRLAQWCVYQINVFVYIAMCTNRSNHNRHTPRSVIQDFNTPFDAFSFASQITIALHQI